MNSCSKTANGILIGSNFPKEEIGSLWNTNLPPVKILYPILLLFSEKSILLSGFTIKSKSI